LEFLVWKYTVWQPCCRLMTKNRSRRLKVRRTDEGETQRRRIGRKWEHNKLTFVFSNKIIVKGWKWSLDCIYRTRYLIWCCSVF
jgi:hypothetical protein